MTTEVPATLILHNRYRLLPTKGQHRRLREALEHSRQLYNAALMERIDCYRKTGTARTFFDQSKALTELRQDGSPYSHSMERAPLRTLDQAFKAFYRRGGFPRFKGRDWFKTIRWADRTGWRVRDGRFCAKGIGAIRIHANRPLPPAAISVLVKREGRNWYLCIANEVECGPANDNPSVGLDLGIASLAALSTGEMIVNVRSAKRGQREARRLQRALSRCRRGSGRRRKVRGKLARSRTAVARARDTHLHQVSANLVSRFGLIAVEALNVKGLSRSLLAREVHDVAWGKFIFMLRYKAERAGSRLIEVDPRYTSQTCPECGEIKPKELSERVHSCPCGCVLDRDVAAAKVILLRAAVHGREALNVAGCGERAPRKVAASGRSQTHTYDQLPPNPLRQNRRSLEQKL
jgi:putative transposase